MARIARAPAGSRRQPPLPEVAGALKSSVELLGVRLDPLSHVEALDRIEEFVEQRVPRQVVTVNLDFLRIAASSGEFKATLNQADLALADGMPLVWASRTGGAGLPQRIAGIDLVEAICARGDREGWSVFLLGAAPGVAEAAGREMARRHPNLRIAGTYSPPHGVWDQDEETYICDFIRFCRPDVLLVALGAPRQDVWIRDHIEELGVPVSIGVGCTLDVLSGGTPRAPRWMRRTGLEWLYRLSSEPGRLWKRYLLDLPLFAHLLLLAARDRLTGRNTRRTVLPNSLQGGAP